MFAYESVWRMPHCFVLPVLEYYSAVWCSAADTHLRLQSTGSRSQWCQFFNWGVLKTLTMCDLAHRRSVAVLCMLYKIRCNSMHPLYGALPVTYVPVRVTRGALIAHLVHVCALSLQNLSVSPDIYSLVSVSVERS